MRICFKIQASAICSNIVIIIKTGCFWFPRFTAIDEFNPRKLYLPQYNRLISIFATVLFEVPGIDCWIERRAGNRK